MIALAEIKCDANTEDTSKRERNAGDVKCAEPQANDSVFARSAISPHLES